MYDKDPNSRRYIIESPRSLKDYVLLVNNNRKIFLIIVLAVLAVAVVYALYKTSMYESTATLRIVSQPENILQSSAAYSSINEIDRTISNQIGVIQNYNTRKRVADALIDSMNNSNNKSIFNLLIEKDKNNGNVYHKSYIEIAALLKGIVKAEQVPNMDAIDLTAESPSPGEAALITNTYAEQYKKIDLEENRKQLNQLEKFLAKQSTEKKAELDSAESVLANFKEKGRVVALSAQSNALINQLSQLNTELISTKMDLMSSNQALEQYKTAVSQQDPKIANYMENQTSQAYISALQKQIAELQMNRDMALANKDPNIDVSGKVKEYDRQIQDLKEKLKSRINDIKTQAYSSSPQQITDQTDKLMAEEVRNRSLKIRLNELESLINSYNGKLANLPKESMELSQYERNVQLLEQLYTQLQQKYQEVRINELSKTGNVIILSQGRIPDKPSKPLGAMIIIAGLFGGIAVAFGFVLIKDYFKNSDKIPVNIDGKNIQVLPPAQKFKKLNKHNSKNEVILLNQPQTSVNDTYKVNGSGLRTTVANNFNERMVLISSAKHGEGKTSMAVNLASRSVQSNQNTLLIDCDLRIPMVHKILNTAQEPGLTNYLMNEISLEETIRQDGSGLYYITSGALIHDPSDLLASDQMEIFLNDVRKLFDFIVIVSAPVVQAVDTEILSNFADGIILVVSSDKTDVTSMSKAMNLIKNMNAPFMGTVLNDAVNNIEKKYSNKFQPRYPLKLNNKWK